MNFIKTTQAFYYRDEKFFYEGETMCEIQFKLGNDIRIQKRSFMKMTEVFAITGGYMQLISTIFKIVSLLCNKLDYEMKLINSLFNIYPNKNKITLKNILQKKINDYPENKQTFSLYRTKKPSFLPYVNSKINGIDKDFVNRLNINDYLIQSINLDNGGNENSNNQNMKINKSIRNQSENCKNKTDDKMKESSICSDNKNKSKINLLNLGINFNLKNKIKIIPNKDNVNNNNINNNIFEENTNIKDTNINMNIFYYYFYSKCKNNNNVIKLFNLATSFYKNKMDIIHLFYIILIIEKISKNNKIENKS